MVDIISERRQPSFGERLNSSLGVGLEKGSQLYQGHKQNKALEKMGIDPDIYDPEYRKVLLQGFAKKKEDASINKIKTLEGLKKSISEMKQLAQEKGIGLLGNFNQGDMARYNRGRMQTLKGELLNYYKTLFPRGLTQQEFKKLESDYLPSNLDTVSGMDGKLDAFSDLIERKLESEEAEEEKKPNEEKKGKVKFNLKNPEHKAKRDQLMKKFNNDREKVQKALLREFQE
jgi:hypothetical protein